MNEIDYHKNENKVANRLKKMIEANQYLAGIESLDSLLPKLLELAKSVTSAEASSLMLYNPDREVLEFASVSDETIGEGGKEKLKKTIELKLGEGIAGWVAQNRRPIIIEDARNDPRFFDKADRQTGFTTRTLLCVPLLYGAELLGVINVLNAKEKPCFDVDDQAILESFSNLATVAIVRSRLLDAKLKQQKLQIQMEAAAKIQSLFCPRSPEMKAGSHAWAVSMPAAFVGGDLYDFIPMVDGSWVLYVADVSGKGLPAAMVMVALWSRIRSETALQNELENIIAAVNNAMYGLMADEGYFATIILGRYWPTTGKMQLTRAGHLLPLLIGENGLREVPELKGISLGVSSDLTYEKKEVILSPGESIIFLSDGVTEAENKKGEMFGQNQLINLIQMTKKPPWGIRALEEIMSWRGSNMASDDLTMLEIWRDPEGIKI